MDFDASDEATGLPSLDGTPAQEAMLVLKGAAGDEGIVMLDSETEPVPVRYLHVRGLVPGLKPGSVEWGQISLAIPEQVMPQIIESLTRAVE